MRVSVDCKVYVLGKIRKKRTSVYTVLLAGGRQRILRQLASIEVICNSLSMSFHGFVHIGYPALIEILSQARPRSSLPTPTKKKRLDELVLFLDDESKAFDDWVNDEQIIQNDGKLCSLLKSLKCSLTYPDFIYPS